MAKTLKLKCLYLGILILVSFSNWSSAQEYTLQIDHYGIEEGLSHRNVHSIYQDIDGLLWIGTQYGLNRFDGHRFKWYTKETHGLRSNNISHILADKEGLLWLFDTETHIQSQSLDIFDSKTETSQPFEEFFPDLPFSIAEVIEFTNNEEGTLAFLTKKNDLFIYDDLWQRIPLQIEPFTEAYELKWAPNDWIWLVTNHANDNADHTRVLQAFDLSGKRTQLEQYPGFHALNIHELKEGGVCRYTVTNHQTETSLLYALSPDGAPQSDHSFNNSLLEEFIKGFTYLQRYPHHYIKKGPFYLLSFDKELFLFTKDTRIGPGSDPSLSKIKAHANFLKDSFGRIWAYNAYGIYRIRLEENKFDRLLYNLPVGNFAARNMCVDDENQLWAVREGILQLWKEDLKSGAISTLNQSPKIQNNIPIDYTFNSIIKGQSGLLYFATRSTLTAFDSKSFAYNQYDLLSMDKRLGSSVWYLYEDKEGKFWYTLDSGRIGFWDGQQSTWITSLDSIGAPKYAYHFYEDQKGLFWLATDRGLFVLDNATGAVKERYWSEGKKEFYLPYDNVFHIHEEEDGTFWLGTGGTGLIHWNKSKPLPNNEQFTRAHGLNNVIYAVYEDEYNNFWLPSDNGIIRFNKNTYQTQTYLEEDGITHHEFNRISHYQADDGRLFFGGLNGVTAFHPNDFTANSAFTDIPLIITDFQLFDAKGNSASERNQKMVVDKSIVFEPDDRFFRLEFALLTYQDVDKNRYAYKVEGVDKDWNHQRENFIRFSRLPYGNHVLRIKGQGVDGQWSANELAIELSILKPFYLQTWFLLVSILSLLGAVFLFFKWRTGQLEKQKRFLEVEVARQTEEIRQQAEELKSLEKLKSRFFANVSHELRTPLTLMLGPVANLLKRSYWQEKDRHLLTYVNKHARHLLKLINEILDLSKLEANRLEIKETAINFFQFLQPLVAQFSSFSDSEGIHLTFDYRVEKHLNILLDINKFEKIVHNFLSNALKFTPQNGRVDFIIEEITNGQLLIKVKDTGTGIHPDDLPHIFDRFYQSKQADAPIQGGTGIGLSLCLEMAELLEGKVWAESELGKGSVFYFQFPKKVVEASQSMVDSEGSTVEQVLPLPIRATPKPKHSNKPSILIVEDNHDLRSYMESFLSEDYQVTTAENGKIAWDLLTADSPPNLIISDLMMPIMDGFQLLEKIKSKDALRHLPVIMLTARADVKVKLRALRIGVDDYLTKPFVEEELKVRMHNLLKYAKARKEAFIESKTENVLIQDKEKPILGEADVQWLEEVEKIFAKKLHETQFKIDWVAIQLHLSQRQLSRRLKKLTGMTPNQYLREMRLNQAKDFLLNGKYLTVKETCFAIGLKDVVYFSERFQERFGLPPSEYL